MKYIQQNRMISFVFFCSLLFMVFSGKAFAYNGWCEINSGTLQFSYDFGNKSITNIDDNVAGKTFPDAYTWDLGRSAEGSCDCPSNYKGSEVFYQTATSLVPGHTDGTRQYYKVNDYIELATEVWVAGNVNRYIQTPWYNQGNDYFNPDVCKNHAPFGTGSKGRLSIYIARPFIGTTLINNIKVVDIFGSVYSNNFGGSPISSVYISGTVTVPQSCTLNSGSIVTVDFGNIVAGKFNKQGEKPDGVTAKTINVPVKCNGGVESMANLTMRFQATPDSDYSSAIVSDKTGVGVVVTDMGGNILKPDTGLIPFKLNDSQATVSFQTYPVSTTGIPPSIGKFTALAYIRVDFA